MTKATMIVDLQFGSTGKGLIAGHLAEIEKPDTIITAWSMNAGHTFIDAEGTEYIHCMLANGVVSPNLKRVLIGPGSQVGISKLFAEADDCSELLQGAEVLIHPHACVIQEHHVEAENKTMTSIGSTKKGCGAALSDKIRRNPNAKIVAKDFAEAVEIMAEDIGVPIRVCTVEEYEHAIDVAEKIHVEGAQGYSLGINSGFYPYTTSRECTPAQLASDCSLPLSMIGRVVGTMRTFPIRVANRYDDDGKMIGWSGPGYADQEELSFADIGQTVEYTTVTKLPRRIFSFSNEQCRRAMRQCMPTEIFLNFAQYPEPEVLQGIIDQIDTNAEKLGCGTVKWLGWGPRSNQVNELKGK